MYLKKTGDRKKKYPLNYIKDVKTPTSTPTMSVYVYFKAGVSYPISMSPTLFSARRKKTKLEPTTKIRKKRNRRIESYISKKKR